MMMMMVRLGRMWPADPETDAARGGNASRDRLQPPLASPVTGCVHHRPHVFSIHSNLQFWCRRRSSLVSTGRFLEYWWRILS